MSLSVRMIQWSKDKERIVRMENSVFGRIASDASDLERQLERGFGIVAVDDDDNGLGYAIAIPLERASYHGFTEDAQNGVCTTAYIESLAIKPGASLDVLLRMVRALENELDL